MQKLSKKLVKKLIYEAIADVKKAGPNREEVQAHYEAK